MTQFCLAAKVALIGSTLNLDFSFDHIVFITAGAVLPGKQRINSTILKSLESQGVFCSFQKKICNHLSDTGMFSLLYVYL
jgi:hypothetical protein